MPRRPLRRLLLHLALALLVAAPLWAATRPPHLVVILTDDQTADSLRFMPRTRRLLVERGTSFADATVSTPLCCPSRATFLTGQYSHNHRVLTNAPPEGGVARLDERETLAVWLRRAGYATAHLGKYLNRYGQDVPAAVPPGWSRWFALVDPSTYRLYDYTVSDDGRLVHFGTAPADYQTDVLAREAERTLRRHDPAVPLFLVVAPVPPHLERSDESGRGTPPRPAPRHTGAFADEPLPRPPSFDEADVADKPPHLRRLPRLGPGKVAAIERTYRSRLAALLAVDELVERVVTTLDERGMLDDSLVLFTSDNGFFAGEHRLADGKYFPYEEAIRVPLVIRGGGFPAGRIARQPVSNVDLAPTLLAAAGAAAAGHPLDGVALGPLARDPRRERTRGLLVEGRGKGKPAFAGVRTAAHLYVEYAAGARELYDLRRDPYQLRNLAGAPAVKNIQAQLAARLGRLRRCRGAGCR